MQFHYFQAPTTAIEGLAHSTILSELDIAACSFCGKEGLYLFMECDEDGSVGNIESAFPNFPDYFLAENIDLQQLDVVSRRPNTYPAEPDFYYRGCLECLKEGRFTLAHQTEAGDVINSRLYPDGLYSDGGLGEQPSSISSDRVKEIARTPSFNAWQDPIWLTHCNDFMVYLGEWGQEDFNQHAPDGNGQKLHATVVQDVFEKEDWQDLHGDGFYLFKCDHCGMLRSYSAAD